MTKRAVSSMVFAGLAGLVLGLGVSLSEGRAQPVSEGGLENAIGDCIGKEGATGDAVGDITIDLKTGRVVYRCDSDPKGAEKVLESGAGRTSGGAGSGGASRTAQGASSGGEKTSPAGEPAGDTKAAASTGKGAVAVPAADHGAAAAYVNTPRGPAPDRPQDCVGAHPYYLTFPVCIMARKMGLLGDQTPEEATAAAAMDSAAPAPGAVSAEGAGEDTSGAPAAAAADVQGRTIGALPEDAADAAARASEKVNAVLDAETAGSEGGDQPVGSVSGGREEDIDWMTWALWAGAALGGLLVVSILGIGVWVVVNHMRMKRMGDPEDPYLAFFDDPDDLSAPAEGGDFGDGDMAGLFGELEDDGAPLGAFDDEAPDDDGEPLLPKAPDGGVDDKRAFTA